MAQRPTISIHAARLLTYKARVDGGDTAILSGDCSNPVTVELRGAGSPTLQALRDLESADWYDDKEYYGTKRFVPGEEPKRRSPPTCTVYVQVRCRKHCPQCLEQRRKQWTARAIAEVRQSTRTWFGTMTVGPDRRFWAKVCAERFVESARQERFCMLTPSDRTKEIARHILPEFTRFLKRVRKESRANIRYLQVVEPHKDGFPHFHILLHERDRPVAKSVLERQWTWGFSQWRLVPPEDVREVGYVCKYVSKNAQTRVRASLRYGQIDSNLVTEAIADALQLWHNRSRGKKLAVP